MSTRLFRYELDGDEVDEGVFVETITAIAMRMGDVFMKMTVRDGVATMSLVSNYLFKAKEKSS